MQPAQVTGTEAAELRSRLGVHELGRVLHVAEADQVAELVHGHQAHLLGSSGVSSESRAPLRRSDAKNARPLLRPMV